MYVFSNCSSMFLNEFHKKISILWKMFTMAYFLAFWVITCVPFFGQLELIFGFFFICVRDVMGEGECVLYTLCI